jgi:hypothetical protein
MYKDMTFTITHGYSIRGSIRTDLLNSILLKIVSEHKILTTKFFRNEKIFDADWEAHLNGFVPNVDSQDIDSVTDDFEDILGMSADWRANINLYRPFGILILRPCREGDVWTSYAIFSCCAAMIDHASLNWLAKETFRVYNEATVEGFHYINQPNSTISQYTKKEKESFEELVFDYRIRGQDMAFWLKHLTEGTALIII